MSSVLIGTAMGVFVMAASASAQSGLLEPVDVNQVRLGGEFGRRIAVTIENNILVVDVDGDFVAPFEKRESNGGYVGLGKFIDAMARLAAHTGDERLIERKRQVVRALLETQEPDGYMGMMRPESRIGDLWDVHEMSYLVMGLASDYAHCGETASLEAARRLADHLIDHLDVEPRPKVGPDDLSVTMPDTGLEEAFLDLYRHTGDEKYGRFAREYRPLKGWNAPLVLGRWGKVEGHAYAHIDKCLAQLRVSLTHPDPSLRAPSRDVMRLLLEGDGLVITGTCGDHECWHDTQSGLTNLGETCTAVYLLRFWDELMRQTGAAGYGDLMERVIYNALFAAQSPDGRRIRYYTPFETAREYYAPDTYCCPCNYRRGIADLPRLTYYRAGDAVLVNLYTPSTLNTTLGGGALTLRQETDYPNSGRVTIAVEPARPTTFPLQLRKPRWCAEATARVNGESVVPVVTGGGFWSIEREWRPGDRLELTFEMPWRLVKGRRAQAGRAAVMRGPQLFTLNPARTPAVKDDDPRLLALDTTTIEGPFPDATVRPDGMACRVKVWRPGVWYPFAEADEILLTEYADPDAVATYFTVPNPNDERLVDDELGPDLLGEILPDDFAGN